MAEYINRDAALDIVNGWREQLIPTYGKNDEYVKCLETVAEHLETLPAADVMGRKPMAEDVEELIGMMRDYAKECASGDDMCASCQFSYFCEDGWTPDAISDKLVELANQATERKTGRWISYIEDGYLECPFCGAATNCDGDESELHFCFSCGAKMEVPTDV